VDLALLREELTKLPVSGYSLEAKAVKRGGFRGTKVDVIVDAKAQPPDAIPTLLRWFPTALWMPP
jgi:uncharacterized protein (DUF111 family)